MVRCGGRRASGLDWTGEGQTYEFTINTNRQKKADTARPPGQPVARGRFLHVVAVEHAHQLNYYDPSARHQPNMPCFLPGICCISASRRPSTSTSSLGCIFWRWRQAVESRRQPNRYRYLSPSCGHPPVANPPHFLSIVRG